MKTTNLITGGATTLDRDYITIYDAAPAADDSPVAIELDITNLTTKIAVINRGANTPILQQTALGNLFVPVSYSYGSAGFTLKNTTIIAQPELRIMKVSAFPNYDSYQLVYNSGGATNNIEVQDADGNYGYTIWDLGSDADRYPQLHWSKDEQAFYTGESTAQGYNDGWMFAQNGRSAFKASGSNGNNVALYVDTTTITQSEAIIHGDGADINVTGAQAIGGSTSLPGESLLLPILINPLAEDDERLVHNGGGGIVPIDIPISSFLYAGLGRFITPRYQASVSGLSSVVYNEGNSRFQADIGTGNVRVYFDESKAPNAEIAV